MKHKSINDYQVVDGTYYNLETPPEVIKVLEDCRNDGTRIILDYGDTKTGLSWGDIYDISGYVGRSTGPVKAPILLHSKRSSGGGTISSDSILSIKTSKGKKLLYQLNLTNKEQ